MWLGYAVTPFLLVLVLVVLDETSWGGFDFADRCRLRIFVPMDGMKIARQFTVWNGSEKGTVPKGTL